MNTELCQTSPKSVQLPPCPPPGAGVHSWIMSAANRCRILRLPETEAERLIVSGMTRSPAPANEIRTTVAKAYSSGFRPSAFRQTPHYLATRQVAVPIADIHFDP